MTGQRLKELAHRPVGKLLLEYSTPAVIAMLVMSMYNIVGRIFIGQSIDAKAIAGLAVTFPVSNLATALGVLVGAGASARVSIHLGANRHDLAVRTLGNALKMTIIIGISYISVFAIWLDDILMSFGASENTLPYAREYMQWLLPGLLLTNLSFSFNNIQRASGYPKRAMWTMIISAAINIALTPIFIFVFDMGIHGAALASDIAMAGALVFVMWHFFNPNTTLHFERGTFKIDWSIIWGILTIGAAPALVNAAGSLVNMLINTSLLKYGSDEAVGAAGIFTTYTSMLVVVVLGVCQGMQPILGYNYGAQRYDRLKRTYGLAVIVGTVVCAVGATVSLAFPELIARAFTPDSHLIDVTTHGLRIATMSFFVVGFQIVTSNFFQSLGLASQSIVQALSRQVIFLIPLLVFMPSLYGLTGIWISFPISDVLATVVSALFIWYRMRIINRQVARGVTPVGDDESHVSKHSIAE